VTKTFDTSSALSGTTPGERTSTGTVSSGIRRLPAARRWARRVGRRIGAASASNGVSAVARGSPRQASSIVDQSRSAAPASTAQADTVTAMHFAVCVSIVL
jgi:hypothetical protein